ncbi:MAG: hypothetical protein V1797_11130 [Pseudomonadota bacterium]
MYPIFEQGDGQGLGINKNDFIKRFDSICRQHADQDAKHSFAFMFYNFSDKGFKRVLKDQKVFVELDRLSGSDLSLFYFNAGSEASTAQFNSEFLAMLGIKEQINFPCLVFFKIHKKEVGNVAVVELGCFNSLTLYHDLFQAIKNYIQGDTFPNRGNSRLVAVIKSSSKYIALEALKGLVNELVKMILRI